MQKHNRRFYQSMLWALTGIWDALKYEVHLRIHLLAGLSAVGLGLYYKISRVEWLVLSLTISLVIFAELMNTALESNVDMVTTEKREDARMAKDIAAGAVLVTSINALVVGWLLFGTRLLNY